ncbi:hypothetical protein BG011_007016 [Mortierella polycephala]|uniref:EXS-domain-containing protein n=1 Tax=Mortierella polycephala TaxID=41804 RepID=A0A9P6PTG4_9FUNG|nr:hypothetical protein BG011_007016 [Mortierella polycephala]
MKFAKYLQAEAVPEWRKAYINYKQGKKYLKAIERALDLLDAEVDAEVEEADEAAQDTVVVHDHQLSPIQYFHQHQPLPVPPSLPPLKRAPTQASTASTTTTPIITRSRGHGRNYSAIIIPPHPGAVADPLASLPAPPNSNSLQGSIATDEDRIGAGESTVHEDGSVTVQKRPQPPRKSSSSGFPFVQARTHSTQFLRNISRRFTLISPSEFPLRTRSIQVDDTSIDAIMNQLLPEERVFFDFLDTQLETVNNFYQDKELEAVTKLRVIRQQLYVANEWKRRYDERMAKVEAEHGWYVSEWSRMRKGFDNLIRTDVSGTEDVTIAPSKRSFQEPEQGTSNVSNSANTAIGAQPGLRYRDIYGLTNNIPESKQGTEESALQEELVLQEQENRRQHLNHKVARTRIKAALYEFYRSLEMIKNYKVLNHTGFSKILKKFDKTAGWKGSKPYINSKLKPSYFMNSTIVQDLIAETENVFIDSFEKGHRRRGMAKLRIPDSKNQTHHLATTRIGLYMGLAVPLLVQALQAALSSDTAIEIPYWDSLLFVYGGLFLTILFTCLFGINMYTWSKSRINYKFIFEFDPRDNLDFQEYFELPIFFMLLLTLAVYLDFGSKMTAHVATMYWPLILVSIIAAIMFCPLPIAHFTARRWFLASIGRIIASGYYRVEFRDFFLADEMNSLAYSIEQFEFAICAYAQQWSDLGNTCTTSRMWITPFVTALPAWFRFLQCLRRYRDTLEWFPHLLNAGKYSASLINLFVYFSYRHYGGPHLKVAWIFMSLLTSVYTFSWDVYMDWGLFRFGKHGGGAHGHPFLRQELVYSRAWVYYVAIVLDFLGRFSWVVRLIPMDVNVHVLSFALAFFEVLRRWQWNFFRLENEHLNNCGQFRAIKDIPLPFHIHVQGETDDEEDEDEDERRDAHNQDQDQDHFYEEGDGIHAIPDMDATDLAPEHKLSTSAPRHSGILRSPRSQDSFARRGTGGPGHGHGMFYIGSSNGANASRSSVLSSSAHNNRPYSSRIGSRSRSSLSPSQMLGEESPNSATTRRHGYFSHDDAPVHPFGLARSNSFVEAAVAEAGFKDAQLDALETETRNKFYDRRDFDSKIIDADSNLWGLRDRPLTEPSSIHGLHALSQGAARSSAANEGAVDALADTERRPTSLMAQRRKTNMSSRIRQSIFGRGRSSDSEEEDEQGYVG